jgi:large subunit ribosomal protein L14e
MVAIEIGRVCKKLQGREAGRYCVVVDTVDEGYVMVTGPRDVTDVRKRQCNILHLEPTDDIIDIKKGASDEDVKKALEKAKLTDKVASKK